MSFRHSFACRSSFELRHCLLTLLLAPCALLSAAPPPELTVLRTQYDKVVAERVTAPFEAAKGDLDAKFTGALDRIADEAKKEGKLEDVLAILEDKKRLAQKFPLPEDDDKTSEPLKKLRAIYRGQLQKLEDQRAANHQTILPAFTAKLQALETTLTKADRVEEAKEVMDYREGLAQGGTAGPPGADAETAQGAARTTMPPAGASPVKGDDRKAAEWVLSFAVEGSETSVRLDDGRNGITIHKLADLPKGRISVLAVSLDGFQKPLPAPVPDEDLDRLAGLQSLKRIHFNRTKTTDAGMRFLATCPAIEELSLHALNLGDGVFAQLAGARKLKSIAFNSGSPGVTAAGLKLIAGAPIERLELLGLRGITDEAMEVVGGFKNLRSLLLSGTQVTDAGIARLSGHKMLKELNVGFSPVSPDGLLTLKGVDLSALMLGSVQNWKEMAPRLPALAAAFPNVVSTNLPRGGTFAAADVEPLAQAFPRLQTLNVTEAKFEPGAAAAIARLTKLEKLVLWKSNLTDDDLGALVTLKNLTTLECGGSQITDAGLAMLAKAKSLKSCDVRDTKVTPDGMAAFKKARPAVTLK